MTIPGFTAEVSLYKMRGRYRDIAWTADAAADLSLALMIETGEKKPDVDCNDVVDAITCHECNATGPGTFSCCALARKKPEECIVSPRAPSPLGPSDPFRGLGSSTGRIEFYAGDRLG
jgi:hypothetical protein